jgi:hypothetical protein
VQGAAGRAVLSPEISIVPRSAQQKSPASSQRRAAQVCLSGITRAIGIAAWIRERFFGSALSCPSSSLLNHQTRGKDKRFAAAIMPLEGSLSSVLEGLHI